MCREGRGRGGGVSVRLGAEPVSACRGCDGQLQEGVVIRRQAEPFPARMGPLIVSLL
jgi:hypothetical protein